MNKDFLDYYSSNLAFLRKSSGEFASEFPKIASRLDLNSLECLDPFVERLLEGTAFLAARVEKKLDDGYPRYLESVLDALAPGISSPIPSLCVLKVQSSDLNSLGGAVRHIGLNTDFRKVLSPSLSPIRFSNVWETSIVPFELSNVRLVSHDLNLARLSDKGTHSALTVDISSVHGANLSGLSIDYLQFFLNLNDQDASFISRSLIEDLEAVYFKSEVGEYIKLEGLSFDYSILDEKMVVDGVLSSFDSYGYLQSFLAYPALYKFLNLRGLEALNSVKSALRGTLVFVFKKDDSFADSKVSSDSVLLNCIPAINLFKCRTNRLSFNQSYELNVVVDNTAPLDYEIFYINYLEFFNSSNQHLFNASPFFSSSSDEGTMNQYDNFFTVHRRKRTVGINDNKRTHYQKSEAFVSVSGDDLQRYVDDELLVSADCYATNADLPLFLSQKDFLSTSQIEGIHDLSILTPVVKPRSPLATKYDSEEFKKLTFVMQNICSILNNRNDEALMNIRTMISSFSVRSSEETSRMVNSLSKIDVDKKVFRYASKGCIYFENGFNVSLYINKNKLEGVGLYTFSRVLIAMLQSYTPLNIPVSVDVYDDSGSFEYSCKISKD